MMVRIRDVEANQWFATTIAPTGKFDFQQNFAPGKYELDLSGGADLYLKSLSGTGVQATGLTIEIGAEPVKLTLTAGRGLGHVDGVALRDGKPQGGARVVLIPENRAESLYRRDQSDSDGTFVLTEVVPGNYVAIALQNWDLPWEEPEVLKKCLAHGQPLFVAPGGKYNVQVEIQ
jgi:hypothetical protein